MSYEHLTEPAPKWAAAEIARLRASEKALLEALKIALPCIGPIYAAEYEKVRAAIAKATESIHIIRDHERGEY